MKVRSWKRIALVVICVLCAGGFLVGAHLYEPEAPSAVVYVPTGIPGVEVVKVDPVYAEIKPAISAKASGQGEPFTEMIDRLKPEAAINGTFFDEKHRPLGDIVIDGILANRGHYPNALAVKKDGSVEFIHGERGNLDWSGYKAGIGGGPRLVRQGKVSLDVRADGFSPASLRVRAPRSGVATTATGKLLLVTASGDLTLEEFADIMVRLGAVEAMNLDGGSACGLYVHGKYIKTPGLWMTNILAVYNQPNR